MSLLKTLFPLVISITFVWCAQVRFDNYRVYEIFINNQVQLDALQYLEQFSDAYSFWESPIRTGKKIDVMVPPHKFSDFDELASRLEMRVRMKIENVQRLIDSQQPKRTRRDGFGWTEYHTLDEMYDWMDGLASEYQGIVTVELVGHSYEGREVRAIKLSHKEGNPGIFLESHIHAREWITSATATWILNELLSSSDEQVQELARNYDWYILPVVNPDGLNYTQEVNRMWRKTRYPHSILCSGVDMNRNFPYHWMDGGSSANPCSDTYAGPKPASEVESQNIIDYFVINKDRIHFYLSFHSYGQLILLPFGYQDAPKTANFYDWMEMAEAAAIALAKRYGTSYTVGNTAEVLYIASGSTRDWALGEYNVSIAASYEFRDTGDYGFLLPEEQIIPNSEEVLDSLVAFLAKARELEYFEVV
ncbi:zinc carboxypeptidase-like [Wyeomyia smithii]|uniref:zinc carboxypeptidase-like n=1 Tax=Wyeomyia smithii TaxID=174621 RepID=UPI002467EBC6|nr:zinc carboxypeptidase-like [Wyeomyia smithii]